MKRDKFLIFILILFVISLFLPESEIVGLDGHRSVSEGYFMLFFGWIVMFDWFLVWLAKPLFLIVLFRFHRERAGVVLFTATLVLCLGLTAFMMKTTTNFETGHEDPVYLMTGYFVWIGTLALFVLYSLLNFMGKVNNRIETGSE